MTAFDDPSPDCPHRDGTDSGSGMPLLVGLDDERALDPALTGGKAAALARARRAGLATLPGAVLTTEVSRRHDAGTHLGQLPGLAEVLSVLGGDVGLLVVRSSSVAEDQTETSAAGQFASVLDVDGYAAFAAAVTAVLASRQDAGAADRPIAVLVQPLVEPDLAGVAFGVDPVSGRSDRRVVTAVRGRPSPLVSGEVEGSRWTLDPKGKVHDTDVRDGAHASRDELRSVVAVGERLAEVFGGPQDIEWALVGGRLLVLQSRPVTTVVRGVPAGPVFGPGPVAETFPEPLSALEQDLWVPPLRDAVRDALRISGTAAEGDLANRELIVTVGGRVAMDLEITGEDDDGRPRRHHGLAPKVRRLRSAWRIGRLRAALPVIADDLADQVDADLTAVPPLEQLSTRQLVALVDRGRDALHSLHAHEILMGLVAEPSASPFTGASVALRVLAEARADGGSDEEILRRAPVVLALVPPRVGAPLTLPSEASTTDLSFDPPAAPDAQVRREALRLRVRWVQELVGQAACEIGRRLARRGALTETEQVRHLRLDELAALVTRRAVVDPDLLTRRADGIEHATQPLPVRFQLSDRGLPVAVEGRGRGGGTGAGGGEGRGPVTHDAEHPPDGSVLVVSTLTPGIGPQLPHLRAIVSETGSVLSHLAILAREAGVAVVVGHHGAQDELPAGTVVHVDGQTGRVTVEETP